MKEERKILCQSLFLHFNFSFLIGVATNSFFNEWINWFWVSALSLALLVFIFVLIKVNWAIIMVIIFSGFWMGGYLVDKEIKPIKNLYEGNFSAIMKIVRVPEEREKYQQVIVEPIKEKGNIDGEKSKMVQGRVLIYAPLKPSYRYGEILRVKCELRQPESQFGRFDYQKFLAKNKIYQVCNNPRINKLENNDVVLLVGLKDKLLNHIFSFRRSLENSLKQLLPQPEGAYLAGLLLGGDGRLPAAVAENFRLTGTTHVVAVSGSNIAIISNILIAIAIALGFWRQQAFLIAITGVIFFVLMIGAPASAIRAAIMGGLLIWAVSMGRLSNSGRATLFAATVMTAFSPLILVYDVGFQLSVTATLGIIYFYPYFKEKYAIKNDFLSLRSIFFLTLAAQIGVFGVLVYNFETFSLISPLANLIIVPFIPFIMFLGAIMLITSVYLPLAKLFVWPVFFALRLEILAIEFLAKLPGAQISLEGLSLWWVIGYYVFLILIIKKMEKTRQQVGNIF